MRKILVLLLILISATISLKAQTTKGTDFWLSFMENYLSDDTSHSDEMRVYITADYLPASGIVSLPLGNWFQSFNVLAGSTVVITIPTGIVMCTASDSIENKGVHITSDNPVTVYQLNHVKYTSDANIVLPTSSLGRKYIVTTYTPSSASQPWKEVSVSELAVVAAYDNTVIRILPKCNTMIGHTANIPFTLSLNRGEVYQLKSAPSTPNSLTGTLVEIDTSLVNNDKPFAVFSGNLCGFVPGDSCCCDHLCEEMMPVSTWGTQYITVPLYTRARAIYRIVASQNGTSVIINGGTPQYLNSGDCYEIALSQASYINSSKPVSVAQFSESSNKDGVANADPFMVMLSPLDDMQDSMVFNAFLSDTLPANSLYMNIVARTNAVNSITLDGTSIAGNFGNAVSALPEYSFASIEICEGNHSIVSDSGFAAIVYSYEYYDAFGYCPGTTLKNFQAYFDILYQGDTTIYYKFKDTIFLNPPAPVDTLFLLGSDNPDIAKYSWNFGDASADTTGKSVYHLYQNPGNYTLTMTSFTNLDFNDTLKITCPIVVYSQPSGIKTHSLPDLFEIYPNPATDRIIIETLQKSEVEISTIEGQILSKFITVNQKSTVDIRNFASGVYLVKVKTDKRIMLKKFVKQ